MASTPASDPPADEAPIGAVLFAYDGSELARFAIEQAGRQLAPGRDALVLCVWQTGDVGFVPTGEQHFKATAADEVKKAAEADGRARSGTGTARWIQRPEHHDRSGADLEGDRRGRRAARRESHRARLPPPHRPRRPSARERHGRRGGAHRDRRADRAPAGLRSDTDRAQQSAAGHVRARGPH